MTEKEELKLAGQDILTEHWLRRHYGFRDEDINYLKAGRTIPVPIGKHYIEHIEEGEYKGLFRLVRPKMSYGEMLQRYGPGGSNMWL